MAIVVTNETLDVLGLTRELTLAVPSTYAATKRYPLVLVLHGDETDGAGIT